MVESPGGTGMLDLAFIRENPELLKEVARQRNTAVDIDLLLKIDSELRQTRRLAEDLRAEQNRLSKAIREAGADNEARERAFDFGEAEFIDFHFDRL